MEENRDEQGMAEEKTSLIESASNKDAHEVGSTTELLTARMGTWREHMKHEAHTMRAS